MPDFYFKGRITLRDVDFIVGAETHDEARKKALQGDFDEYDVNNSEAVDWDIFPNTCKPSV